MVRTRAVKVCSACHERKVKCDIDIAGVPCSKCVELGDECEIRSRKPYNTTRRKLQAKRQKLSDNVDKDDSSSSSGNEDAAPPKVVHWGKIGPTAITTRPAKKTATASVDETRNFTIPVVLQNALTPEDLGYLQTKGCFSLPPEIVCQELIQAYFEYVHPSFPVLDGQMFLKEYSDGGLTQINLLLLWSMFSIAASYISDTTLATAGYETRKSMKAEIVHKAKLMFDSDYEHDRIVLTQSALLISFWLSDIDNIKQSWYWTGIASSFAQAAGLHRWNPSNPKGLRNLWCCCMLRDAWVSFAMGRPLRINRADCEWPLPSAAEIESTYLGVIFHGKELYTSQDVVEFAELWHRLLRLSNILRSFMTSEQPSHVDLSNFDFDHTGKSFAVQVNSLHYGLYLQAARISIARKNDDRKSIKAGAKATTRIIKSLVKDNVISYVSPVAIPLLVPAMLTYLTSSRRKKRKSEKIDKKLDVYFNFLTAVQDSFPAATILHRFFTSIHTRIKERHENSQKQDNGSATEASEHLNGDFLQSLWDIDWQSSHDYASILSDIGAYTVSNLR